MRTAHSRHFTDLRQLQEITEMHSSNHTVTFWDTSTHVGSPSPDDRFLAMGGVDAEITIAYCWTEAYRALPQIHLVQQCDI